MNKNILIIILSIFIIFASFFSQIIHLVNTPKNREFTGFTAGGYSDDYNYYLSVIKQGIDGNWTVTDKYTGEPHEGTFMHLHYLLIGKLGGIFNLPSTLTYQLARIFSGILFLITVFFFVSFFTGPKLSKLAFFITLFSSPWFFLKPDAENWWQKIISASPEPHPLARFSTQPHFLLASIYTLITFIVFIKLINCKLSRLSRIPPTAGKILICKLILYLLFSAYVALSDPAQTLVATFSTFLFLFFITAAHFINKTSIKTLIPVVIIFILNSLSVFTSFFYLKLIRNIEPWKQISAFDTIQAFPTVKDFFLSFGPTLLLALITFFFFCGKAIKFLLVASESPTNHGKTTREISAANCGPQKFLWSTSANEKNLILISWLLSTIILVFFLSSPLIINRLRLYHTPIFVCISIFAALGIETISQLISKRFKIHSLITKSISILFILFFSLPIIITSLFGITKTIDKNSILVFANNDHLEAFNFLSKNRRNDEVVLCMYEACNQIPYYSGNTVFIGNITNTLNEHYKNELSKKIFMGIFSEDELKKILKDNYISLIFSGYQEKGMGGNLEKYSFITPIFKNEGATIYSVISNL